MTVDVVSTTAWYDLKNLTSQFKMPSNFEERKFVVAGAAIVTLGLGYYFSRPRRCAPFPTARSVPSSGDITKRGLDKKVTPKCSISRTIHQDLFQNRLEKYRNLQCI